MTAKKSRPRLESPEEYGRRLAREREKPLTEEQIEGAARILAQVPPPGQVREEEHRRTA